MFLREANRHLADEEKDEWMMAGDEMVVGEAIAGWEVLQVAEVVNKVNKVSVEAILELDKEEKPEIVIKTKQASCGVTLEKEDTTRYAPPQAHISRTSSHTRPARVVMTLIEAMFLFGMTSIGLLIIERDVSRT